MGNYYFRFKQFIVYQDLCGMKVCTDSCIFGALIDASGAERCLDIGTGTGLLSLMVAQKSETVIDAVEIDHDAYKQAIANVEKSPWAKRISVRHSSLQEYFPSYKYDVIFCNPPFYKDYLKSGDLKYDLACHSENLSPKVLVDFVQHYLKDTGNFYILYPEKEFLLFEKEAARNGLFSKQKVLVRNQAEKPVIRIISAFSKKNVNYENKELVIRNADNSYTEEFERLLKDYYYSL